MRLKNVRAKVAESNVDGMLITDPLNRRYLSGFSGTAGWLLVTPERAERMISEAGTPTSWGLMIS